jgi:Uma2 family endonuclease
MAGERNAHNLIATDTLVALGRLLRCCPCWPYNSTTKIRIRLPAHFRFYYPEVSVICRPNSQTDLFQDEPAVLFEVLSQGTRRTDEGEKKEAYLTIPSLGAYVLIEQEFPALVVYRRTEHGIVREIYTGLDAVLQLPEIGVELPLAEIYETVEFSQEPESDDESWTHGSNWPGSG